MLEVTLLFLVIGIGFVCWGILRRLRNVSNLDLPHADQEWAASAKRRVKMAGYNDRWSSDEGEVWKSILDHIKETVEKFSVSLGVELAREQGDVPGLDVQWYTDDIGRSVQILIDGTPGHYELRISGSAWKDFGSPRRERKWIDIESITTIPIPSDLGQLDLNNLDNAVKSAGAIVSGWTEGDLVKRNDLPSRPLDVTASMVKGAYIV